MAKPVPSNRSAGQPPIVLARLPRVGAAQPVSEMPSSPMAGQTMAPPETVAPPETIPQLDLRTEIAQRTQLHIADTPADDQAVPSSHFVDRRHAPRAEPTPEPMPQLHQPAPARSTVAPPTSMGEKLFQLHAQLAPHAGLIVAMALIASAGLLYWMIVGPSRAPVPDYQNYGNELGQDAFGATSNYQPQFTAQVKQPAEQPIESASAADDAWTKMSLPAPPAGAMPDTLAMPKLKPPQLHELPPIGESASADGLQFLKTETPADLDYSKITSPPAEMARRPTEPTNR